MDRAHETRLEIHANIRDKKMNMNNRSEFFSVHVVRHRQRTFQSLCTCVVYGLPTMVHATTGLVMKLRSEDGGKSLARHQIQSSVVVDCFLEHRTQGNVLEGFHCGDMN